MAPRHHPKTHGFTLVELMIVVAMVGVLATLAMVGYKKYIDSSKTSEPIALLQSARSAQESFRAETMGYLNVSASNTFYPRVSGFDSKKVSWEMASHPDYINWRTLAITTDGPVRFGYRANAGLAGTAPTQPIFAIANWPANTTEPWYVVQAQGDPGDTGTPVQLVGCSFTGELFTQNN